MTTNETEERPLPDGWKEAQIDEVANLLRGVSYKKAVASMEPKDGHLPILRATNIQDEDLVLEDKLVYVPQELVKDEQLLQKNDIVICMSSGSKHLVGKAARLTREWDGSFGTFCAAIRFDSAIEPRFGGYFFGSQSYRNFIREKSSGVNINNLRRGDIESLEFPIPPFREQESIADEIEKQFTRLDQAVASLKRLQSNLARYKASVLKAACEGRLVPQNPADESAGKLLERILAERRAQWEAAKPGKKYKEPVGVETAVLPDLPKGWITTTLAEIVLNIQTGPFGSSLHKSDYVEDGIPVINPASIIDGKIRPISRMAIDEDTRDRLKGFILRKGDVIMGRRGEMGRSAMVTEKEDGWLCGTGSLILRFAQPISRQFMVFLFGSESVKAHLGNASVGTTMQNLNQKILLNMVISLPPEAEQERIVAEVERRLSVVAATEQAITANLARAERLRQSILGRAFTGQLVPQEKHLFTEGKSIIFDSSRFQDLKDRYQSLPNHRIPRILLMERKDLFGDEKIYLERVFEEIPQSKQKDVLASLITHKETQHIGAWFELMLFGWLRDQNIGQIIFEPEIDEKTPDFLLIADDQQIIIEARAFTISDQKRRNEKQINDVWYVLNSIVLPFVIMIENLDLVHDIQKDKFQSAVTNWLQTDSTKTFSYRDKYDNHIELSAKPYPNAKHLYAIYNGEAEYINPQIIKKRLKKKAEAYKQLAKSGYAYIIALFIEPTSFTAEEVVSAWFGQTQYLVNPESMTVTGTRLDRSGLHYYKNHIQNTSVSGTLVVKRNERFQFPFIDTWYVQNPFAKLVIDPYLVPAKSRFIVVDKNTSGMKWVRSAQPDINQFEDNLE